MNRITNLFQHCHEENRKALVGFLTGGDPNLEDSIAILDAACGAGLDLLELGVPFSDATADGPVIQRADIRALNGGISLEQCLRIGTTLRAKYPDLPIILFGYYNPIMSYGTKRFANDVLAAGLDGLLCVDLPVENFNEITDSIPSSQTFNMIRLISPTTTEKRMKTILEQAEGFVYIQSRSGVTGVRNAMRTGQLDFIRQQGERVRSKTTLPTAVGFGISSPEDAETIAPFCDGIIVGSAFIRIIEKYCCPEKQSFDRKSAILELTHFIKTLKAKLY